MPTAPTKSRLVVAGAVSAAVAAGTPALAPTASAKAPNIAMGYDNNPHAVWCVQHLINDWAVKWHVDGYHSRPMAEDGIFGNWTDYWVRRAQDAWMGGDADGIVGPATGNHLIEDTQLTGDTYYGGAGHYCYYLIPTG
ncbi:peptidoglycan-binding domain-containing protein [Streptomyces sp. NPDC002769]|uniref:peptidoglycan-binding domain-containing protein n=1 Tax=Streptomyces sp. NPDC002769 TaxID=3154542 RepID=UPI0033248B7A